MSLLNQPVLPTAACPIPSSLGHTHYSMSCCLFKSGITCPNRSVVEAPAPCLSSKFQRSCNNISHVSCVFEDLKAECIFRGRLPNSEPWSRFWQEQNRECGGGGGLKDLGGEFCHSSLPVNNETRVWQFWSNLRANFPLLRIEQTIRFRERVSQGVSSWIQ